MPQRQNLKPALADTLRSLRNDVQSGATVPHGIKTVEPGEGLQLVPPGDGAEIFWDWETANTWDTRIQEGRAAIEQARADLDKAEQDLAAGVVRLEENQAILDALGPRVDFAESTAAQVSKDLTAVSGRLDTTAKDLTTLQGTVGDVSAKAAASEQKATDALTKAGAAQTSADGKNQITRATSPASQPGKAVGDTHFTMSSMGSGGVVTRQQRWDGSAWQDETVGHQVLASLDLGKATVGELDGIRIKANTVTTAQLLVGIGDNYVPDPFFQAPAAWTVPGWIDPKAEGYRSKGALVVPAGTTQRGAYMVNRGNLPASRRVRFSVWVSSPTALQAGHVRVFMRVYKADGSWVFGVPTYVDNTQAIAANTWGQVTGDFVAPDDGATFMVGLFAQSAATNVVKFSEMQVIGQTQGELIVNGSITSQQVNAESVAAAVGQFVKVQAGNVEVTDALSARVVQAMTAQTKNLVVTESAILQHTTLLGTTVADELNVRKLIRGRDAILDGTVDINQLNVTGAMAAEVVRAMDTETRNLVVTEDAVLNRATVVQGLVTSELISQKADIGDLASRMITSGLLQTTTAANRGVKIDNAGIRAWDETGSQTVQINGRNNYLVGELSTAPDKQRVRLRSTGSIAAADFFGSNNTKDHLAIWHQADAGVDTVSKIIAHSDIAQVKGNPGMLMFPFRGEFAFTGRWAQESDSLKFFRYDDSRSLPGGGYMDITYTYTFPFTSQYTVTMPFLSMETATGRECVVSVMEMTYSTIKFRVVNKSAGDSGAFKVRGVIFNMNSYAYTKYE